MSLTIRFLRKFLIPHQPYGCSGRLRRKIAESDIGYMADASEDTFAYLSEPDFGVSLSHHGCSCHATTPTDT
jgi:hypothetical protein